MLKSNCMLSDLCENYETCPKCDLYFPECKIYKDFLEDLENIIESKIINMQENGEL